MTEEIKIEKVVYEKEDDLLLERVFKLKRGASRIIIFMIVGMIVGWFSFNYTRDSFIITKVIFAIPYKISEAIYVSIIGTDAVISGFSLWGLNEFFTQSVIATFLAERITPVIIGMIIFGSLAYFTGDKRVFTLQRFAKFIGMQGVILALFVAGVYGVNAKAISDNNHLKDVEYFFLMSPSWGEEIGDERAEILLEEFEKGLKEDKTIERDIDKEIEIGITLGNRMRHMEAKINTEKNYLVTQSGVKHHVSEQFSQYVQEYYETGSLMGVQNIYTE